jgi:uncharacterized protein (DUF2249 family)
MTLLPRLANLVATAIFISAAHAGTTAASGPSLRPEPMTNQHQAVFTDEDRIGTLRSGANCELTSDRLWSELVKQRVEAELPRAFDDELIKAAAKNPHLGVADGVAPLRMQALLNKIDFHVCQGPAGAWRGGFTVQVTWQVLDPESDRVLYQGSTSGAFTLNEFKRIPTAHGLHDAFGVASRKLLADRRFAAALSTANASQVALAY